MLKVAITGNIAAGKSQAEKFLSDKGYMVYDADKIAHEVLNSITEFYNQDVFTSGRIDRKKLGRLVFNNPEYRKKLEEMTHPKIKEKILELFEKHKDRKIIFVSVPLLYEAGFELLFDKVIFIKIDENIQKIRLIKRNNFSEKEAEARINAQLPQLQKSHKADFVINNNSSVEDLEKQLTNVLELIIK